MTGGNLRPSGRSGSQHVWNTEPYIEKVYPLAEKIKHGQRFGDKVYRRRVIVVEDWEEVPCEAREGEVL